VDVFSIKASKSKRLCYYCWVPMLLHTAGG
jgi:hypothetical protein